MHMHLSSKGLHGLYIYIYYIASIIIYSIQYFIGIYTCYIVYYMLCTASLILYMHRDN